MVATVIVINLLIAGFCFFVAWKVWLLRRVLRRVNRVLVRAESATHRTLYRAPEKIQRGELGIYQLRQSYQRLEFQLRQVQQAIALLSLGQLFLRRQARSRRARPPVTRSNPHLYRS